MAAPKVATTAGLSLAGQLFFSSLCAGTFGLGCWQTQRYFEKIVLTELREQELRGDPTSLPLDAKHASASSSSSSTTGFSKFRVQGTLRHDREVLVGPRGPPPGSMASTGPKSGRAGGGMSASPQGYFVITPLDRNKQENLWTTRSENTAKATTVLVNRGWVPIQYVKQNAPWNRPKGTVEMVVVPAKTEQPQFLSPVHSDPSSRVFYWYDRPAIEKATSTENQSPLLVTQVTTSAAPPALKPQFPVQPPIQTVGEYKVTPFVHAGYAVTWFGLSGAGIYMTRKLMTRGRG